MELTQQEIEFCLQCAKLGIKVEDVYDVIQELAELCKPMMQLFEANMEYMKKMKQERKEK